MVISILVRVRNWTLVNNKGRWMYFRLNRVGKPKDTPCKGPTESEFDTEPAAAKTIDLYGLPALPTVLNDAPDTLQATVYITHLWKN